MPDSGRSTARGSAPEGLEGPGASGTVRFVSDRHGSLAPARIPSRPSSGSGSEEAAAAREPSAPPRRNLCPARSRVRVQLCKEEANRSVRGVNTNRLTLHRVIFLWIYRRGPLGTRAAAQLAALEGLPQKIRLLATVSEQQKRQATAQEPPALCRFVPPLANSRASYVGLWFASLLFGLVFFGRFFPPRVKTHTFFIRPSDQSKTFFPRFYRFFFFLGLR